VSFLIDILFTVAVGRQMRLP